MKSTELKAPNIAAQNTDVFGLTIEPNAPKVFLAGSIEMGEAELWHESVIKRFPFDVIFFNPKRDNWDSSWKQEMNNAFVFQQVTWELNHLDDADIIYMYFDPNTKSPITLLELGLYAMSGKLIVCCPEGFWRKANVDIVCQTYGIPMFSDKETSLVELRNQIQKFQNKKRSRR